MTKHHKTYNVNYKFNKEKKIRNDNHAVLNGERLPATLLCSHSTPSMHVHFSRISLSLLLFFISSMVKLHNNVADLRRVDSKQTQSIYI